MISNNLETSLPQAKFAYNSMVNRSTSKNFFEIVYTCFPCHVFYLVIMPSTTGGSKATDNMAKKALQIHAEVQAHLGAPNAKDKSKADKHRLKKVFQEVIW